MKSRLLCCIVVFCCLSSTAWGFDGQRKGFVFGLGFGMAPLTNTSLGSGHKSNNRIGLATNLHVGVGIDARNMLLLMRDGSIFKVVVSDSYYYESTYATQGFTGVAWSHYFGIASSCPLVTFGLGFQDLTSLNGDYQSNDMGLGVLVGLGYQITYHWQLLLNYSFGGTSAGYRDFTHKQLQFELTGTAF